MTTLAGDAALPVPFEEITEAKALELGPVLYRQSGALNVYLDHIRAEVNELPDLTTKKGRDRVASLAAGVSRSKTAIDKPGRAFLKHLKESVKPVEKNLKAFVDACDELRDQVRKPLTDWEAEQECRRQFLQAKVDYFGEEYQAMLENMPGELQERAGYIKSVREQVEQEPVGADFEDFLEAGQQIKADILAKMTLAYQAALIEADEQRKQQAAAAEAQALREQQIAAEAAAKAKADAEAAAQEEIDAANRKAEQAKADAQAALTGSSSNWVPGTSAQDREHRKQINNQILSALQSLGIDQNQAKTIIEAAARGQLGRLTISY